MKGKVCIVTGANSALGIGRATVHQFAQNGAKAIYLCDFSDDLFETHKRELKSLYPEVEIHARQFDASDEPSVEKVVAEAVQQYGRLDVFFGEQ
jgi:NAD(P)-dependent dehydrogenase (short-subunit alcohol dehydrogenase family)